MITRVCDKLEGFALQCLITSGTKIRALHCNRDLTCHTELYEPPSSERGSLPDVKCDYTAITHVLQVYACPVFLMLFKQ